jgi:hypothetical protein
MGRVSAKELGAATASRHAATRTAQEEDEREDYDGGGEAAHYDAEEQLVGLDAVRVGCAVAGRALVSRRGGKRKARAGAALWSKRPVKRNKKMLENKRVRGA